MPVTLHVVEPTKPVSAVLETITVHMGMYKDVRGCLDELKKNGVNVGDTVRSVVERYFVPTPGSVRYRTVSIVTPSSLGMSGQEFRILDVVDVIRKSPVRRLCSIEGAVMARIQYNPELKVSRGRSVRHEVLYVAMRPVLDALGQSSILVLSQDALGSSLRTLPVTEDDWCYSMQKFLVEDRTL